MFPDKIGNEVSKYNAVASIVQLASLSGEAITDVRGRNLFGGHSLRTGGAVTLAGLGLDSVRIECLARWHSPMLAHYARLAPLKTLTSEYKAKAKVADANNGTNQLAERLASLQKVVDALVSRLDAEDNEKLDEMELNSAGLFVLNCRSNIWHLSAQHDGEAITGQTVCRWKYSSHNANLVDVEPFPSADTTFCNRCLPKLAMVAKTNRNGSESSSSSSSSAS